MQINNYDVELTFILHRSIAKRHDVFRFKGIGL